MNETCDYDTGTAFTGPSRCGRTARFIWDDPASGRERPVCGLHARSVRSKFLPGGGSLSPIEAPGTSAPRAGEKE